MYIQNYIGKKNNLININLENCIVLHVYQYKEIPLFSLYNYVYDCLPSRINIKKI